MRACVHACVCVRECASARGGVRAAEMADPEISHRESLSVCVRVRVRVRVRVCIRARWCARCPRSAIGNRRASLPPLLRPIQRAARHPPSWTRIQCQPRPSRSQQRPAARRELAALEALKAREDAGQAARGRVASATRSRARPVRRQRPSTSETIATFERKAEDALHTQTRESDSESDETVESDSVSNDSE